MVCIDENFARDTGSSETRLASCAGFAVCESVGSVVISLDTEECWSLVKHSAPVDIFLG